jgi:DNA polymerase-1
MQLKRFGICPLGTYEYLEGPKGSNVLSDISRYILDNKLTVAVDLETTGTDPLRNKILLFSFAVKPTHSYVFSPDRIDINSFLEVLATSPIVNHFIKFDYEFIKATYGINVNIAWDTQVTHAIATAGISMYTGGNSLGAMVNNYLGIKLNKAIRKDFLTGVWETDDYIRYAAADPLSVLRLLPYTKDLLEERGVTHIWETIERDLIYVIASMELNGINVDIDCILNLRDKYQIKVNELDEQIKKLTEYKTTVQITCGECKNRGKKKLTCTVCGGTGKIEKEITTSVNPGSPKQLVDYLKKENIVVPTKERPNGSTSESVGKDTLAKIRHPLIPLLMEYREYYKALSSFLIPWSTPCTTDEKGKYNPITKCIHPEITQTDTDTGRISMKSPNLQQVPKGAEFREVFCAPEGEVLVVSDYSQIELRVLAELSNDENMIALFQARANLVKELEEKLADLGEIFYTPEIGKAHPELAVLHTKIERDNDIHSQTAIRIFKLDSSTIDYESTEWKKKRSAGKAVSFGIPYGSGARTVAERSNGALTQKEAEKIIEAYFKTFPGIKKYIDDTHKSCLIPKEESYKGFKMTESHSILGRKRYYILPNDSSNSEDTAYNRSIYASIQRKAVNQPIQGTSADITKMAMVKLYKEFSKEIYGGHVITRLMIHDELVTSCPKDMGTKVAKIQIQIMKDACKEFLKNVPPEVSCNIAERWEK